MAAVVLAISAHPDDIEFLMAGTLALLARIGCTVHTLTLANGSCGSTNLDAAAIAMVRERECRNAARHLSAIHHPALTNDLEIFYERSLLRRVAAVFRTIAPDILLLHSPQDYMEDHMNACRLGVTAAFTRSMPNFITEPAVAPVQNPVCIYHAQPHGTRDQLNQWVQPDFLIAIDSVMAIKSAMLAEHVSQQAWLDQSQSLSAPVEVMKRFGGELAKPVTDCRWAEGWRRHNPLGLCAADANPLSTLLADYYLAL